MAKLIESLNENIVRYLLILNQHLCCLDTRETIGHFEEAKESINIHVANLEKGLISMITGRVLNLLNTFSLIVDL